MIVTLTTNTIEISQDGNIQDLVLKISSISAVSAEPYIAMTNTWQDPNIGYPKQRNLKVQIKMNSHETHIIDLTQVSNQATWYTSSWTNDTQFLGGLKQCVSDIQAKL